MKSVRFGVAAVAATLSAGAATTAEGAGFYIKEQSVTGLGRAFAGEAAIGEDASTIYFNPAAMTELSRAQAVAGAHLLVPRSQLTNTGSTYLFNGAPIGSIAGTESGNPYDPTPVPNGFAAAPFLDGDLWVGVGVTAPFGLANAYDPNWFGRYDSIETELTTINVQPAVAYRINDMLSVGGGVDIQYADAKLTNALFAGPGNPDVITDLQGDDWTVGFDVGVLFKPLPTTRIGVHYRSAVTHDLEGQFVATQAGTVLVRTPGSAQLKLPDIVEVGVAHEATPALTLLGEVTWTGWDSFDEIRVQRPGFPDSAILQGYENSFAVALGAQYELDGNWTLRAGIQYDETPTEGGFRSSRTPDGDRTWLTAGFSYQVGRNFVLDAAYAHIFISEETVDLTRTGAVPALSTRIRAETEGSVDIVSVGLRYLF
ncbi:OmpP1/FadL family transporter [Arenibaculum sp.]|uniref:OmpP1/FadL family transporter n=1 Tax=Arenibaculum sp. TaxID=2865862 RepID=UPI002E16835D|nr:outer membrane protein transport protein [Arenibaculum sp.]